MDEAGQACGVEGGGGLGRRDAVLDDEGDDVVGVGGEERGDLGEAVDEGLGAERAVDVAEEGAGAAVADRHDLAQQRIGERRRQLRFAGLARAPPTGAADSSGGQWWVSIRRVRIPASSWAVIPPSCSGHTGTTSGDDIALWVAAWTTSS